MQTDINIILCTNADTGVYSILHAHHAMPAKNYIRTCASITIIIAARITGAIHSRQYIYIQTMTMVLTLYFEPL